MYYIVVYILVFIINLNSKVAKVLKPIVLLFLSFYSLINLYCVDKYGCLLSNDYAQIIAGTNYDEAKEYFSTYISWKEFILFISIIVISIFLAYNLPRLQRIKFEKLWVAGGILLLISIGAIYHNSGIIKAEFKDQVRWNFRFDEVVDLRHHPSYPKIEETDCIHPEQIVIILGESFSSNHSSLYGYEKKTNPLLERKVDEGNLIVIKNVTSPCTHTIEAFKYILNTYTKDNKDGKSWYEHTNIIETMKTAGYHTIWISNQAEKGMFDNVPSCFAKLCDETYFVENERNNDSPRYDGGLINHKITKFSEKNCIIYHLMGQHGSFNSRYPKEYDIFKEKDYQSFPSHQREVLASYDNATLYNDFVVNTIMELYKDQDAVVFYFPDHALDVFDTDPNYFGHAKNAIKKSREQGRKIPFMVYVSPIFYNIHTKTVERMKKTNVKSFCTDRFIYTLMDVAGFQMANSEDVKIYTLFQDN
jgi:heptose-I-phosphate ethanolaminephosphotransferase